MSQNLSFPFGPGALKVDAIGLGDSRAVVNSIHQPRSGVSNPTWVRYQAQSEGQADTVICYQPSWPDRPLPDWQVHTICGSVLTQGEQVLLKVGEDVSVVRSSLGEVRVEECAEPGYRSMRFGSCLVVLDHNWRVAEITLSHLGTMTPATTGPQAVELLDGSLAC